MDAVSTRRQSALILAAGKGTRMRSDDPKVLCEVLFKPMIHWVVDACRTAGIETICAVTGYRGERVQAILDDAVQIAVQAEQRGTGHAVMCAREFLEAHADGDVIVLNGDAPFIDPNTIQNAYDLHKRQKNAVTVITARLDDPTGYGRIVRGRYGIEKIVEQKDASPKEMVINEVNSGAYWFNVKYLLDVLFSISDANAQGEYYLPDTIALTLEKGRKVGAYVSDNPNVILGANSRQQLMELNRIANRRVAENLMASGVEILSMDGVLLSPDCRVGNGTRILPGTILREGAVIGRNCVIGPNSMVCRSRIGDRSRFISSQCEQAEIGADVEIGPFCHVCPNSRIGDGERVGSFAEVDNGALSAE